MTAADRQLEKAALAPLPAAIKPQLATLTTAAPTDAGWAAETKFDGYRMLARIDGDDVRLFTRRGPEGVLKMEGLGLAAAANAFFEREELWIPRCHRAAKLIDLRFRRMNLEPDDLRNLQHFANQFCNVHTVCEQGGGVDVSLPTVCAVAAEREGVVHATRLRARLGDELLSQSLERVKLPILDLEVRYQGAAGVRRKHSCLLWFSRAV